METANDISYISIIESWIGLLCACLPLLKPFFVRYFPRVILFRSSASRSEREIITVSS